MSTHTLHHQYSPEECKPNQLPQIDCNSPIDMGMQFPVYPWEHNHLWVNGSLEIKMGEDSDLNSTPIELSNQKFQDDLNHFDPSTLMQD